MHRQPVTKATFARVGIRSQERGLSVGLDGGCHTREWVPAEQITHTMHVCCLATPPGTALVSILHPQKPSRLPLLTCWSLLNHWSRLVEMNGHEPPPQASNTGMNPHITDDWSLLEAMTPDSMRIKSPPCVLRSAPSSRTGEPNSPG